MLALFQTWASADVITLKSGRHYEGDIVAEDAATVTLRVEVPGSAMAFNQQIKKSNIANWDRPDRQGVPYVQIPIVGDIGFSVTADGIRQALASAEQFKPQYVVFLIDSNGGKVDTTIQICDLIVDARKDFKIVASVKKAYSAAAMITMACPDIYMMPNGVIGAAVPFVLTRTGPRDIQAKFASALEAKMRNYAIAAGHDDLLLRGMMELNLPIYLKTKDGKPTLDTAGPGAVVKPAGQILTLTATDAARCGLARDATDLADVGRQVTGGAWYEISSQPGNTAAAVADANQQQKSAQFEQNRELLSRLNAASLQRQQANSIVQEALQLNGKIAADHQAINDLAVTCNKQTDQIISDYHNAVAQAEHDSNGAYEIARAKEEMKKQIAAAYAQRDAGIAPLQSEIDEKTAEINRLRKEAGDMLAGTPQGE